MIERQGFMEFGRPVLVQFGHLAVVDGVEALKLSIVHQWLPLVGWLVAATSWQASGCH